MRKVLVLLGLLLSIGGMTYCAASPDRWYGMMAFAVAAGAVGWVAWRKVAFSRQEVVLWAIVFRLICFTLPPGLSDDMYRYVWDGEMQADGINPYAYRPSSSLLAGYQESTLYGELNSESFYSVYPPVSQMVFWAGTALSSGDWEVSYYLIKALFLLLELGGLWLLSTMVDPRSLILYAWQPLVLLEVAGQGHTEAALASFLIATVYFVRQERPVLAASALAAAGWVKLYPFLLFPFLWRRMGWTSVWAGGLAAAALAAPYAGGDAFQHMLSSLDLYVRYFEFNAGLYLGIKQLLYEWTGADWSKQLGPFLQYVFITLLPVLYLLDWKEEWPLPNLMRAVMGLFFVLATTVHPWYLLGILALTPFGERAGLHWHVLALSSLGTYLFYVGGPYTLWVVIGWGGWLGLGAATHADDVLQWVQRRRGERKAARLSRYLPPERPLQVLDLGSGEGYVGEALQQNDEAVRVTLADVLPMNRTALPFHQYDGRHLPFEDDTFDAVLLVFVLHHSEDPRRVLEEAMRVTRDRILVVESVYHKPWDRRLLTVLDTLANRLRSHGAMQPQEEHLCFRTAAGWGRLFHRLDLRVVEAERYGSVVHEQALFVLETVKQPAFQDE